MNERQLSGLVEFAYVADTLPSNNDSVRDSEIILRYIGLMDNAAAEEIGDENYQGFRVALSGLALGAVNIPGGRDRILEFVEGHQLLPPQDAHILKELLYGVAEAKFKYASSPKKHDEYTADLTALLDRVEHHISTERPHGVAQDALRLMGMAAIWTATTEHSLRQRILNEIKQEFRDHQLPKSPTSPTSP